MPSVRSVGRGHKGERWVAAGAAALSLLASGPVDAQALAPGAAPRNSANGNVASPPSPGDDAIPLSPELIDQLAKRFKDAQRAREESITELAAPLNRRINVSFAPGSAVSIINTVKGYPTAVSFFDSTGQPWPIGWDTNSN